ncbi:protein MAINTENANCE OF MERISTEMS-like [Glycine soja]|uniref:protein MAINTENANCE OF MERISTEMS-like n=1 Tax=Glycine soja TaxID=3848 RepID=UPI001038AD25|nr:protein MAINTENANCE OF MERISTEMS-like [Glycine soja]
MVRTRGLGRALGHVTGRGVDRGDRDDFDDAPQHQWPTASARRQRIPVTAAYYEPVVPMPDVEADVFSDDLMAPADVEDIVADILADTGTQAVEDEHEGFLGDPSDPSVLTQYVDHVACSERPELKLSSQGRKVHSLGRPFLAIEGLVAGIGLSPLIACSVDTGDRGLLSSFIERWHRETSSFHLPMGELTITLDDVSSLLHLPVVGDLHAFQPLHVDDAVQMLVDLLMVSVESIRSATNVHVVNLKALRDLSQTRRYAWGVAALCWIYEHFPSIAESTANQDYDEDSPHACSWIATKKTMKSIHTPAYREHLDRLRISDVCWIPYGEHRPVRDFHLISCYSGLLRWGPVAVYYRPERVVRQFGYTQTIPAPPINSWVSYDDIHDRWMHYSDHMVPACEVCTVPGQCASDYMDWFFRIFHPFMTPGHASDPLPDGHTLQSRVVPQAP